MTARDGRPSGEPDRTSPPAVLRAGRWLVGRLVDPRVRDAVEGDLEELYRLRCAAVGPLRATARYLVDLMSLLPARGSLCPAAEPGLGRGRPSEGMMDLMRDLRHAARSLIENPAYSGVVVVTLALAMGANTAIFGVVDGVLLQPLPYHDPGEIVTLAERGSGPVERDSGPLLSQQLYLAWRKDARAFDGMAMYTAQSSTLTGLPEPARISGAAVSPALFALLGVDAAVGRTLAPDEEASGADSVVVLGDRAWRRYFAADPDIVGTTVRMDESARTVVGVMPPGFAFPDSGADYWVPLPEMLGQGQGEDAAAGAARREVRREVRRGPDGPGAGDRPGPQPEAHMEFFGRVVARLADGVGIERAAEEGTRLLRGLREGETGLDGRDLHVEVTPMREVLVGSVRGPLLMLMGAVGFVLLIACANVANLTMARAAGRRRETAVRAALGAGWWNLGRPLLAESGLLAFLGAVTGFGLAAGGLRALKALAPEFIPRLEQVGMDGRAVLFTLMVTVVTALLFSLAPLRSAARLDLTRALKEEGGSGATGGRQNVGRRFLVVGEMAASVILLAGAVLLISSFLRLSSVDHGFDPDNLLNVELQLPASSYPDAVSHLQAYDRLVRRLEGLPTVTAATVANRPPAAPANIRIAMRATEGEPPAGPDEPPTPVGVRMVENDYFQAVGGKLLRGRFFNREDRPETQSVMVLSESGARALFGERVDPLGRRLDFMGSDVEVVGIVADVRTAGVDPTPQPEIFLPYHQTEQRMIPMLFRVANVLVRTEGPPLDAVPAIRSLLAQEAAGGVVLGVTTVRDQLADAVAEPRFYASLVGTFAFVALVLAAVGIYGLLAYTVQQATRETAIRRALGAPARDILRGVVVGGLLLAGLGLAIGVGGALTLARVLEAMLYEVGAGDPLTLAAVVVVFLLVALAAILVPARRAMRVDPMEALRIEG